MLQTEILSSDGGTKPSSGEQVTNETFSGGMSSGCMAFPYFLYACKCGFSPELSHLPKKASYRFTICHSLRVAQGDDLTLNTH